MIGLIILFDIPNIYYVSIKAQQQIHALERHLYGLFHYETRLGPNFDLKIELQDNVL